MLKAYVDAYRVFGQKSYLEKALKNANFIEEKILQKDGRLYRNYKNGKANINAFLDDYALTSQAFIALYQATFDEKWLNLSLKINDYAIAHFYDQQSGMFFFTSDLDAKLIARKMELSDNVIPASNSIMANNLFLLGQYFYKEDYIVLSKKMLAPVLDDFEKNPAYYANWGLLLMKIVFPFYEIAIVGQDAENKRKELDQYYLPNSIVMGGQKEGNLELLKAKLQKGKTMIYACEGKACQLPVQEVGEVIEQLK
jgi:uncharacterized protein